ncbi:MAG: 4-hydroxythreonine-4-phosphate dehydrogenase PdxA [Candidatus Omnitrophota bacterium]
MPLYKSNRFLKPELPTVAITIGDPFGIGPEIVLKALASRKFSRLANFLIVGDEAVISADSALLKPAFRLDTQALISDFNIIKRKSEIRFGRPDAVSGGASLAYLDCALDLIKDKRADCLVTAPVSKEAISASGIKFSGHTEYIAAEFGVENFAMMLLGGPLRVTLATRHLPIRDLPKAITESEILKCVRLSYETLKDYFGIISPRIGVASLNPHGGESGFIGDEELKVIRPAVRKARRRFRNITGPVSSETLFYEAFRKRLDCVIAMYHDQGLTPLKMIARDKSVNVTLGLPFVRTSPGHGTAFDIAGKGTANPESMIEAIKMAIDMHNAKLINKRQGMRVVNL